MTADTPHTASAPETQTKPPENNKLVDTPTLLMQAKQNPHYQSTIGAIQSLDHNKIGADTIRALTLLASSELLGSTGNDGQSILDHYIIQIMTQDGAGVSAKEAYHHIGKAAAANDLSLQQTYAVLMEVYQGFSALYGNPSLQFLDNSNELPIEMIQDSARYFEVQRFLQKMMELIGKDIEKEQQEQLTTEQSNTPAPVTAATETTAPAQTDITLIQTQLNEHLEHAQQQEDMLTMMGERLRQLESVLTQLANSLMATHTDYRVSSSAKASGQQPQLTPLPGAG